MAVSKKQRRKDAKAELAKADRLLLLAKSVANRRNRRGKHSIKTEQALRKMKIPTAPLWMRTVLIIIGMLAAGIGILALHDDGDNTTAIAIIILCIAALFVGLGIFGNRKTVEDAMGQLGDGFLNEAISSILRGL